MGKVFINMILARYPTKSLYLLRNVSFGLHSQLFNGVGVCQVVGVNKVDAVIHRQMFVALLFLALVGTPTVGDDGGMYLMTIVITIIIQKYKQS